MLNVVKPTVPKRDAIYRTMPTKCGAFKLCFGAAPLLGYHRGILFGVWPVGHPKLTLHFLPRTAGHGADGAAMANGHLL